MQYLFRDLGEFALPYLHSRWQEDLCIIEPAVCLAKQEWMLEPTLGELYAGSRDQVVHEPNPEGQQGGLEF